MEFINCDRPFAAEVALFALIGLAGLVTAVAFARHRWLRGYIGASMLSLGFFLWGLYFAAYPFVARVPDLLATGFFISAVLQLFIAVAMIILVLEEVRATNHAALRNLRSEKIRSGQLLTAVASTEQQYRNLFNQAGEAIIITAAGDLRILDLNERAVRLLGLSREEAREQLLPSFCQGSDRAAHPNGDSLEWVNRLCSQPTLRILKKDGAATSSQVESSRMEYKGQEAFQFFFREVTDRRRLEQQLRQAEKLSNLGQMISGVAHELNNPLSVIKGYLDLVVTHHQISPQTRSDLEIVVQESDRAAKLVRQFLSFAHEQPARREMVDVNSLIERVAGLRHSDLTSAGIQLSLDLAADLPSTSADPDQVQQLIINLLSNAIQAMSGSPQPRALRIATRLKSPGHPAPFDGRQRSRRARASAKPHLRAVLHHQTRRRRHRSRPLHRAQHHGRASRPHPLRSFHSGRRCLPRRIPPRQPGGGASPSNHSRSRATAPPCFRPRPRPRRRTMRRRTPLRNA